MGKIKISKSDRKAIAEMNRMVEDGRLQMRENPDGTADVYFMGTKVDGVQLLPVEETQPGVFMPLKDDRGGQDGK